MKAIRSQIIKIKIAQKQLGIDEATKLQQYSVYGVTSCTRLDYDQAEELLDAYKNAGFTPSPSKGEGWGEVGWGKKKYTELDSRGYPYAASSKLRMIEALWRDVSYTKTDESLQLFIKNRTGVDHITFLFEEHARIIITALQSMKQSKIKSKI